MWGMCAAPGNSRSTHPNHPQPRTHSLPPRVTNLSEDVTEGDLQELFRPFGPISRVFLAVDRTTGENRGFAFVNYHHRCVCVCGGGEVGQRCMCGRLG